MSTPFPPLPVELVRTIVELAAEDQPTALALALASHAVHAWVTPLLYHTVALHTPAQTRRFQHAPATSTRHTHTLHLPAFLPAPELLLACPGVAALHIASPATAPYAAGAPSPAWAGARPRRLAVPAALSLWHVAWRIGPAVLAHVTHLRLALPAHQACVPVPPPHLVPRLTHLALACAVPAAFRAVDVVRDVLSVPLKLEMLLVVFVGAEEGALLEEARAELAALDDARLLVGDARVPWERAWEAAGIELSGEMQ